MTLQRAFELAVAVTGVSLVLGLFLGAIFEAMGKR